MFQLLFKTRFCAAICPSIPVMYFNIGESLGKSGSFVKQARNPVAVGLLASRPDRVERSRQAF